MAKIGVLINNLGTPAAPTTKAVREFLAEFLADSRVIEVPRPIWWLILHGIILRIRPSKVKKVYQSVWMDEGSPLLVYSKRLVNKLQTQLGDDYHCVLGMRYGQPSLKQALLELRKTGVEKVIILPLYPQRSGTTSGSTFDAVTHLFKRCRGVPNFQYLADYHDHPTYISALANSVKTYWKTNGQAQKLIMSFHGLPQSYVDKGDPYQQQCLKTAELLAAELQLPKDEWQVTFQSRVGKQPWLQPYTDVLLQQLPKQGVKSVQVICPGFPIDCIETIEEIDMENRDFFINAGGEKFAYIPALNDDDEHVALMQQLVAEA